MTNCLMVSCGSCNPLEMLVIIDSCGVCVFTSILIIQTFVLKIRTTTNEILKLVLSKQVIVLSIRFYYICTKHKHIFVENR